MAITILGLGPAGKELLTLEAYEKIKEYQKEGRPIYFRTTRHPAAQDLIEEGIEVLSFDDVYEDKETFEEVYRTIADILSEKSKDEDILYAVPGHPLFLESTVRQLLDREQAGEVELELLNSLSFLSPLALSVREDIGAGAEILDSYDLIENIHTKFDHPLIITQVFDKKILSDVKLKLMEELDDETEVVLVKNSGLPDEESIVLPLYELDRQEPNHLSSLYIPKQEDRLDDFEEIVRITRALRMPDGCPWDRKQTHESLKRYVLEEAAEVVEAIENDDIDNLQEELGDLLFQVMIHSQIADEANEFNVYDVIRGISEKMIRRHPHVFNDSDQNTVEQIFVNWDKIKREEKQTETVSEEMRGIPSSLTALLVADKIQSKARKVGFDWDDYHQAFEKVEEEVEEVKEEIVKTEPDRAHLQEELGDLLFAVVNVIRLLDMDPEEVLRAANRKFVDRFERVEQTAIESGNRLEEMTLEEMENIWQSVK